MTIAELREELEQVRARVLDGDRDGALGRIERAIHELDRARLLTTSEAAEFLGIRSVNTLKLLLHKEQIPTVQRGNRTLIALGEVERLQESERIRGLQTSDRLHDASAALGETGLSAAELDILEESRPGTAPWAR